ncbi:MAG: efflux RND transporter periplasmic adaptor subunit [Nitrospirales bacterium]|nr:efflux RND transporter periplasmic adaptor subunit [Nitrospirales bacterium]
MHQKFKSACESARQQYEQAVASEEISRKHLADSTLHSPTKGFISKRSVEPGEMVSPGLPVFEIVNLDTVEVSAGVPETEVNLLRVGQKAVITLPALPGESFEGTLSLVNVSADPGSHTFMTRISVPNPEHRIRIGMVAEVLIRGDKTVRIQTLPVETIVRDPQGATMVYIYYPDKHRAYARRVEAGSIYGREIEIKRGLTGEERIVIAGQERLRDGALVSVVASEGREAEGARK